MGATMPQRMYKDWSVKIEFGHYGNGRVAIALRDAEDGEPIATCTTNLPDADLPADHVFIKDYSENEGMLAWLVEQGIVEDTGCFVQSGYAAIPIGKLLIASDSCLRGADAENA